MNAYLILNQSLSGKGLYVETTDLHFASYLTLMVADFNVGYTTSPKLVFGALTIDRAITANEAGFYALAGMGLNIGPTAIYVTNTVNGKEELTDIYYFNDITLSGVTQSCSSSDLISTLTLTFIQFAQISVIHNSDGFPSIALNYSWDSSTNAPIQGTIKTPGPGLF